MTSRLSRSDRERWRYCLLALFVAVFWFATLPLRPLFNPDEGRYAEIPREMLASGDWIVPHLNGLVYLEKPPLQYWATAVESGGFRAGRVCGAFLPGALRNRRRARRARLPRGAHGVPRPHAGGRIALRACCCFCAWGSS